MSSERQFSDIRNLVSGLYNLGETIGTGHFAVVKIARHVFTQKEVAVKVIDKIKLDEISRAHLFQEVMCMKLVQHPNVVRLYEVIDTPNKLYLILELADGGDMYDYIMKHANGLNESLARRYFRQICRALKYCHEMQICHRDLKPENLVFFEKQGIFKLTDFGFSNRFTPGTKLLTSCGSLAYSAPEILLGDPYDAPAVDIWSLGVILFMLVTGRAPFQEANDSETVMMILDCSYKLPSTVSSECQNLIHRMIVRDIEKRATLDEVMSDIWYQQCQDDGDDDDDDEQIYIESLRSISEDDHKLILQQMIDGNIAEKDIILKALNEDQYNHITATYYLLAEKLSYDKMTNHNRNNKRKRRSLQPASDPFTEKIGVFISSSSKISYSFNFADVSLPITRRNSTDDELDDVCDKENLLPIVATTKYLNDSSNEPIISVSVPDDEERPLIQPRTANINVQATPAQAMKIILEEDENPDMSPTDKMDMTIQQLNNLSKLNKITENENEDDKSSISTTNVLNDNSSTTSGILRSKDLRSVIESKRRNFSRSCSSSDSEDNGSNFDMNRVSNRKQTRSPHSLPESECLPNSRGRSYSNIEHVLNEIPTNNQQQQIPSTNSNDYIKRKSFSRASSTMSTNRLTLINTNDDMNSLITYDRTRSLSSDHRLANPSQFSIASRASIRFSTPRESTVFTKTDAPMVVRLLQQTHHQDSTDAIKTLIEHQRSQSISIHQEQMQTPIIIEEDNSSLLTTKSNTKVKSPTMKKSNIIAPTIEHINISSSPRTLPQHSVLLTLKYSFIKHQQQRKTLVEDSSNENEKEKQPTRKSPKCCTIS
ncbi:unnamed protein product [Adineta steineri]|uniref:SNF-related serine/threonine-protein kinase n=2 Tax=Adineta steineri TaxID=433720 RepID=A0A818Q005_9BILA|nr:unnamed protein product [Adineta steineri]CAF3631873.1 unnamed protein product [Adineta steineri]